MRRDVLVALADACGVSIEWLATGRGQFLSELNRQMLAAPSTEFSKEPGRLKLTPEYTRFVESQRQSAIREDHPEPIAPPSPIDVPRLQQAIDIVKTLDGIGAFEKDNIADRVAAAYNVLAGAKP